LKDETVNFVKRKGCSNSICIVYPNTSS